jgi:hypothetical protein
MNITIKITHSNGTVMDISIPVLTPETTPPAVMTPEEPQVASETAVSSQDAPLTIVDEEELERAFRSEDLHSTGKRALSVADYLIAEAKQNPRACDTTGEKRVGEDAGIGRIGGMGERKGEGEGEGGEENHVLVFKCVDGDYTLPPALHSDFCAAFGTTFTERELTLARLWVETNPVKRKTRRGMGRFLNAWMCRAQGEKRTPLSQRTGSLLEASNPSQEGW